MSPWPETRWDDPGPDWSDNPDWHQDGQPAPPLKPASKV
jgi:hypothetical protein